jgi:hypothetical protein
VLAAGTDDGMFIGALEGSLFMAVVAAAGALESSNFTSFMLQIGQFPGLSEW